MPRRNQPQLLTPRHLTTNHITASHPASNFMTSKQVTLPPWNSRKLVHSKEMVWAWRWSVALHTFYRQSLSLLYTFFLLKLPPPARSGTTCTWIDDLHLNTSFKENRSLESFHIVPLSDRHLLRPARKCFPLRPKSKRWNIICWLFLCKHAHKKTKELVTGVWFPCFLTQQVTATLHCRSPNWCKNGSTALTKISQVRCANRKRSKGRTSSIFACN